MAKYKNYDAFIKGHLGKAVDYDHVAGAQCVDLAKCYLKELYGLESGAWGDAHCWYENYNNIPTLKNNFTRIANTPSFVPKKGDIVVWSGHLSPSGHGHIAIADGKGDTTYFYSYDQNWTGQHDPCTRIKHNYTAFYGVLRPKDQSKITGESKKKEEDKKEKTKEETKKEESKTNTIKYKTQTLMVADISQFQPTVDYAKVAKEVDGIIVRIGYRGYGSAGTLVKDNKFDTHMAGIVKNKIPYGFYFFSQAKNAAEGKEEADFAIKTIGKYTNPTFPIYFDSEMSTEPNQNGRADKISKANRTAAAVAFCEEIYKKGYMGGVYASTSWFNTKLDFSKLDTYSIWVAEYGINNGMANKKPNLSRVDAWQFTSQYKINGISNKIDMSYYYKKIMVGGLTPLKKEEKTSTSAMKSTKNNYAVNKNYTLQVDLKVRSGPGINYVQRNRSLLSEDGKKHSYNQTKAVLKKGTVITALEIKKISASEVWIRCASGWVAAISEGKVYIK